LFDCNALIIDYETKYRLACSFVRQTKCLFTFSLTLLSYFTVIVVKVYLLIVSQGTV